jgi:hypothetical protein
MSTRPDDGRVTASVVVPLLIARVGSVPAPGFPLSCPAAHRFQKKAWQRTSGRRNLSHQQWLSGDFRIHPFSFPSFFSPVVVVPCRRPAVVSPFLHPSMNPFRAALAHFGFWEDKRLSSDLTSNVSRPLDADAMLTLGVANGDTPRSCAPPIQTEELKDTKPTFFLSFH